MNQIMYIPHKTKVHKAVLWSILFVSVLIIIGSIFYLCYLIFKDNKRVEIANYIMQPSRISTLYSSSDKSHDDINYDGVAYSIGTLEVPSINLSLPVFSELTDDLLKISACHFYGPKKNLIGNICIAGHNYNDGSLFSNVPNILVGDYIFFTDLNSNSSQYTVYKKYEIKSNDTSCTSQKTNGHKEITLVTCNNFTGNRIIIKAISF